MAQRNVSPAPEPLPLHWQKFAAVAWKIAQRQAREQIEAEEAAKANQVQSEGAA